MSYYYDDSGPYGQLPLFPTLYDYPNPITEERIERAVERIVDVADRQFTAGKATQEQYKVWNAALTEWADGYYAQIR